MNVIPPNRDVIHAFLSDVHTAAAQACEGLNDPGLLQLVRIHPATEKKITVSGRFKIADVDAMTDLAIADAESGHNSYVEARTVRSDTASRGTGEETVAVFGLVLDRDGDKGMAGAQFVEPSLCVETSPGNGHDWFIFDKALPYEKARTLGAAIRKTVGADNDSAVPTQPYRVAGTPNFPYASKRERGRTVCETHYQNGGPIWTYEELLEAAGGESADDEPQAPIFDSEATGEIDATVEELVAEALQKPNRSKRFTRAVKLAVERGMTAADFEALCRANPQGCAQKYIPPERRDELQKRIAEIWQPHAAKMAELDALGAALAAFTESGALQDAEDALEAAIEAGNALPGHEKEAADELQYARMALDEKLRNVVRAEANVVQLLAEAKAAQAALVSLRVQLRYLFNEQLVADQDTPPLRTFLLFENTLPTGRGQVEYGNFDAHPAADTWRQALQELRENADASLPS
jgi:RepB DNA-primase from phage plasmid